MKKWIALILALLLTLSLAACGGKTSGGAETAADQTAAPTAASGGEKTGESTAAPTPSSAAAPTATPAPAATAAPASEETVTIIIPEEFAGTEDEDDEEILDPEEEGVISYTKNEDGSVTCVMTREKQAEILANLKETIETSIDQTLNGEDALGSVTKIEHNDDYSSFRMYVDADSATGAESLYAMIFSMSGAAYQAYSGKGSVDVLVELADVAAGEVTETVTYQDWIDLMSGFLGDEGDEDWDWDWDWDTEESSIPVPEVEKTLLMDEAGITVTLLGIGTNEWGNYVLQLEMVNNSDTDVTVTAPQYLVNDYYCSNGLYTDLPAGETVTDELYLPLDNLANYGVEYICKIELNISAYSSEEYETVAAGAPVEIRTSDYGENWAAVPEGEVIYEEEDIQILFLGQEYEEFWGSGYYSYYFYVQNNGSRNIYISCETFRLNGYDYNAWISAAAPAGKRCADYMSLSTEDLEENGIEHPETLEVEFTVYDNDEYEEIFNTGTLTLDLGVG